MTGPQDAAAHMSATNNAMQDIITSANQGRFQVSPEAGKELIGIFKEYADYLDSRLYDMKVVERRSPLGDSPGGQAIADFNEQVAAGGEDSFRDAIQRGREQTPQVIAAIEKGIALYREIDDGNATGLGGQA